MVPGTRQTTAADGVTSRTIWRRFGRCHSVILLLIVMGFCVRSVAGEAVSTGQFVNRVYRDDRGDHKYVVFVPAGYSAATKWPTVL